MGSEILVNTATTYVRAAQQITALSNGGFVVTWHGLQPWRWRGDGGQQQRRREGAGVRGGRHPRGLGTPGQHRDGGDSGAPQITALSNGGFVVTWTDYSDGDGGATGDNSDTAVKAQVFAADGTPRGLGAPGQHRDGERSGCSADHGAVERRLRGDVAGLSHGVGGATGTASGNAVKAQVFAADGTRVGSEILVNTATANDQVDPQITALSNGGFVVTWEDYSLGAGGATGDSSGTP